MSLEPGRTRAHYEIVEPIGKGGMGEVYRANDTKLGRDVAIKVLPDEFADSEERLARFQREATVLASLNHPNIGGIFGLEDAESLTFLVLELVPGDTLEDRLREGPIPYAEALELARQIADALAVAHDNGVIHRDLKPANIKITPDGQIKVLDFGLAKALTEEPGDGNISDSPTLSAHATKVGVILGTAAYMSPEQARGKPVDKRTDIFFLDYERQAIMAVEIETEPRIEAGTPQLLFEWPIGPGYSRHWDVAPDGQRFVVLGSTESADAARPRIHFVLNWFDELERLVPTN